MKQSKDFIFRYEVDASDCENPVAINSEQEQVLMHFILSYIEYTTIKNKAILYLKYNEYQRLVNVQCTFKNKLELDDNI